MSPILACNRRSSRSSGSSPRRFSPCCPPSRKTRRHFLDLVHRYLDLARDLVDRFTPNDPQHDFRLALRAPSLRQGLVSALRRHHRL